MIKEFSELFKAFSKFSGISDDDTNKVVFYILLWGFIVSLIGGIYKILFKISVHFKQRKINKDLHPFFTPSDIKEASNFFIATKYQNLSPSEDEVFGRRYIASAKSKLIPLFLNNVFPFGKSDNKYYLILGDSGMGKTTFLINLYIKYKNKFNLFYKITPYNIKLIPIWHQDASEYIAKIVDPENTILLLDAFDENVAAQEDYFRTIKNLLLKVSKFRIVVITCRTQFFPSKEEEPHETGYFTAGERGEFFFQKIYISVFDDKDVKKALSYRYPYIWQRKNYRKAKLIAENCPDLIIRPMVLSHIQELVKENKSYKHSFEIYEALINSWIRREARKSGVKEKYKTETNYIRLLIKFSENFALNLYENREIRGGYYISKGEKFNQGNLTLESLTVDDYESLDENDSRTKSLLSRNAIGDCRFSHKSILEYYLALAIFNKKIAFKSFNFFGMDMVKKFYQEMFLKKLKLLDGSFRYKENKNTERTQRLNLLKDERIKEVIYIKVKNFGFLQPLQFSLFTSLEKLILIDKQEMKEIYDIYIDIYHFFEHVIEQIQDQKIPKDARQKWLNKFLEFEEHKFTSLKNHLQELRRDKILQLYNRLELKFFDNLSDNTFTFQSPEYLGKISRANNLIEEILELKTLLPMCNIFY